MAKASEKKIMRLANKLFDELEKSGRETLTTVRGYRLVSICNFDSGEFEVNNNIAPGGGWQVRGKREWK